MIFYLTSVFILSVVFWNDLPEIGQEAPSIDFRTLDSEQIQVSSLEYFKGNVVVLDFWATWCTPCIKAFPKLNELVKQYADSQVTFISVTYEPEHMLRPFFKKFELNSQIATDNDFATFKSFNAWGIPMVAIINKDGKLAALLHPDYLTGAVIEQVLEGRMPEVKAAKAWPDPAGAEEYFRSLVKPKE